MDVDKVLSTLGTREGDILRARYGLDDGKLKTLEEVGLLFSVRNTFHFVSLMLPLLETS